VQWDLGRPYWNRGDETGYCVHSDPEGRGCRVYEHRPGPCRVFNCRRDERIWADFDAMVVNPDLERNLAALRRGEPPTTARTSAASPNVSPETHVSRRRTTRPLRGRGHEVAG
jgi:Putative zinc- or iron-chelating domain